MWTPLSSQPKLLMGVDSKVTGIYWVSSTFHSNVNALNNFVSSKYAAQGKG